MDKDSAEPQETRSVEPEVVVRHESQLESPVVSGPPLLAAAGDELSGTVHWNTSLGHRLFTLVGFTYSLFAFVFFFLYSQTSWFGCDLSALGLPAVLLLVVVAHFIVCFIESDRVCRWLSFIWKGKPVICYRKWLTLNGSGITYGVKHVCWSAIDEIELTWLGNLVLRSRAVCGTAEKRPDIVMKIPYAAGDQVHKNELVKKIREHQGQATLNPRLQKSIDSPVLKGQAMVRLVTSALMFLALMDVGFSLFYYLELLKNYYLAELHATIALREFYEVEIPKDDRIEGGNVNVLAEKAMKLSQEENLRLAHANFQRAEQLTDHPFPLSWVSAKLLQSSNVAAGIKLDRSNVLWLLGNREKAISETRLALKQQPGNFNLELRLVRLLEESGQHKEAMEAMKTAIEDHEHSLLPKLYDLALKSSEADSAGKSEHYKYFLDRCYLQTFGLEPWWPPGGDRMLREVFNSWDLRFVFDRVFEVNSKQFENSEPSKGSSKKAPAATGSASPD
ncbi:MAG: hypothetical protein K2W95_23530 [Candidatus Obscuribacterales bacterium]|nr:hypothetical protein [Candidatus Obscuribacterales bacterium]